MADMTKTSRASTRTKVRELEPYSRKTIDLTRFKPDLTANEWKELLFPPLGDFRAFPVFHVPIETLGPTKTVGLGRTNLTIIRPTILQADAATPYIGFDRTESPSRNPAISMHFEPGAYGFTTAATYVMVFTIQAFAPCTFTLQGFAGSGTVANAGTKTVSGQTTLSLVLRNVQPSQVVYGYLEQTAGAAWNCFSVRVRYPSLVLTA